MRPRFRGFAIAGAGAAVGAALTFVLDPDRGHARRARLADQARARRRRLSRRMNRRARYTVGVLRGLAHRITHPLGPSPIDDAMLVQKVKSEALGSEPFAHWPIAVDAADGEVMLRGELVDSSLVKDLEDRVRHVRGVREVKSLLHAPGTPAPNKQDARRIH
jgi:hypothetical protein